MEFIRLNPGEDLDSSADKYLRHDRCITIMEYLATATGFQAHTLRGIYYLFCLLQGQKVTMMPAFCVAVGDPAHQPADQGGPGELSHADVEPEKFVLVLTVEGQGTMHIYLVPNHFIRARSTEQLSDFIAIWRNLIPKALSRQGRGQFSSVRSSPLPPKATVKSFWATIGILLIHEYRFFYLFDII